VSGVRIGIDIGGTFTDIVVLRADGSLQTKKISSTVDDYARAIVTGLGEVLRASGVAPAEVAEIRHGTTVASNAILERKGAKTGLIATAGFRDILEIRTLRMPRLYDMAWQKPPVLVPRYLRVTVDERLDAAGRVQRPLAAADAERAVRRLLEEGVEAIAVCPCTRTPTRCTSVCSRTPFGASPRICPARSAPRSCPRSGSTNGHRRP
jgi:N-methylhydantoinase A